MDNYKSDMDRDDRAQYDEDLARHRADLSPDDRGREDRARHMINPENAQQQKEDIRFNHSLKCDPLSRGYSNY